MMDMRMPNMDGLETTRAIKVEFPRVAVLVLSAFEDEEYLTQVLRAGAKGYVLKHSGNQCLVESIRRVLNGAYAVDQQLAVGLLVRSAEEKKEERETAGITPHKCTPRVECRDKQASSSLTPREADVLGLLARGQTNRQIGRNLQICEGTVKQHVRNTIRKLGVRDRTQAAVQAIQCGLLEAQELD
jgi:DNA-binding NarL/FixJ family response regulator